MPKISPELEEQLRLAKENSAKSNANADKEIASEGAAKVNETIQVSSKTDLWIKLVPSLSVGILGYGILVLVITAFLIYRGKVKAPATDGQWLIRALVIPMCVIAAVFLTVVGYDSEQMSPVIGLLGTIIGYLLGAGTRANGSPPPEDPDAQGNPKRNKGNGGLDVQKNPGGQGS